MKTQFTRDRVFWNVSLQTAIVASFVGGFGPAQSLLQKAQGTSLTVAGLHGTAFGIASIVAGFLNARIAHKFGRDRAAWIGILIFMIGGAMVALCSPVYLTIPAVLIAGTGISITINNMVTTITHHFGTAASKIAIAQSNAISAAGSIVGTAVVSAIAIYYADGSQWKFGLLFAFPFVIALYLYNRNLHGEHIPDESGHQRGTLSRAWWMSWVGIVASISVEFCTTFWAAALIKERTDASAAVGTACVIAYGSGLGLGRWYGGIILKRYSLDQQLYILYAINLIGFMIFWFSHNLVLSIVALFVVGLGISMQFPLITLRLILLSDHRPDLSQGITSNGAGLAIAFGPFALATIADQIGISSAYLMVPILILIALVIVRLVPTPEKD